VANVPTQGKLCYDLNPTTASATLNRRLCVTCTEEFGSVYIRVQSNTLPNHCVYWGDGFGASAFVDFKVKFQPKDNAVRRTPSTLSELNDLICDHNWAANIPFSSDYSAYTTTDLSTYVGVSLGGVLFATSTASNYFKVDPLYPSLYETVSNINDVKIYIDSCLTSIGLYQDRLHFYTMASPCILDQTRIQKD
jgi:hypothetical protein